MPRHLDPLDDFSIHSVSTLSDLDDDEPQSQSQSQSHASSRSRSTRTSSRHQHTDKQRESYRHVHEHEHEHEHEPRPIQRRPSSASTSRHKHTKHTSATSIPSSSDVSSLLELISGDDSSLSTSRPHSHSNRHDKHGRHQHKHKHKHKHQHKYKHGSSSSAFSSASAYHHSLPPSNPRPIPASYMHERESLILARLSRLASRHQERLISRQHLLSTTTTALHSGMAALVAEHVVEEKQSASLVTKTKQVEDKWKQPVGVGMEEEEEEEEEEKQEDEPRRRSSSISSHRIRLPSPQRMRSPTPQQLTSSTLQQLQSELSTLHKSSSRFAPLLIQQIEKKIRAEEYRIQHAAQARVQQHTYTRDKRELNTKLPSTRQQPESALDHHPVNKSSSSSSSSSPSKSKRPVSVPIDTQQQLQQQKQQLMGYVEELNRSVMLVSGVWCQCQHQCHHYQEDAIYLI